MQTITREQLDKWQTYQIGKPCPLHPENTVKEGKWGNYCGGKTTFGSHCDGGLPTEEFLTNNA